MSLVNYTNITKTATGVCETENGTYNVTTTIVSNESQTDALQSLKLDVRKDGTYLGVIQLENGRETSSLVSGADLIAHYGTFREILDEVLGNNVEEAGEVE
ncbi:MAG: hypothetical protein ACK5LR_03975 [Mangrovibacterium sp.]